MFTTNQLSLAGKMVRKEIMMRKLLGFMILCIPLYAWGSESFSVSLSLHEHPRYAMSTSYDDRYSPLSTYRSPNAIDYCLEGVGGIVGGVGGAIAGTLGLLFLSGGALDLGAGLIGVPLGFLFGMPAGVAITGKLLGCKGSYWGSFLGTTLGIVGSVALIGLTPVSATTGTPEGIVIGIGITSVAAAIPIISAVWGYHLGGPSY
jgi:hypothetical protein